MDFNILIITGLNYVMFLANIVLICKLVSILSHLKIDVDYYNKINITK